MVDFAGWSMPLLYRGIIDEHQHTRSSCSIFDVSHMGRLKLTGPDAEGLLEWLCTRKLAGMTPGMSRYTHMCREDGGILDDVIVSRYEESFLVVCNGANRDKILAWMQQHATGRKVKIEDRTTATAMVAMQGPRAIGQLEKILHTSFADLKRYRFREQVYMTFRFSVFRSGYTGEDGVELIVPINLIKLALPALVGMGDESDPIVKPAGLGARDTLRLEAGMPLYGHELSEDWDSLSAGQGWCVSLDDKDFIGAEALRGLRSAGLRRRIVGLILEGRRTARQGQPVVSDGTAVGRVTSGALSPTLGKSIALALIDTPHDTGETPLAVDFNGKAVAATAVKLPFYKRGAA
jgi:aminomethyltransferase